ncbi:metallophosphoesterase family protein [Caproicibacter sp.]|uniref:metallophosphoesterase family protein n=1 Tax=Caproicibacter sp. TaxID=2814884 RepID=UPI003989E522
MRILVVSDTHRDSFSLRAAILKQPRAEVVIHLGDGEEEAADAKDSFRDRMFLMVRGNCDWGSTLPDEGFTALGGKNIFYTHGYTYNVKYGIYNVVSAARGRKADILLFGHTHTALTEYRDGLYIMNPGSLCGSTGTYGILDITPAGIVTNILKV